MVEDGNIEDEKYDNDKDDAIDGQPPLVSRRVERLKRLNMKREIESNGTIY